MYAYPHTSSELGGLPTVDREIRKTWRCISIFAGTDTGTLGKVVELALGRHNPKEGSCSLMTMTMIPVTLYHAEYVGSGGNCGMD